MKKQGRGVRETERNKREKATGHRVQRDEVQKRGWEPDRAPRWRPSEVTGYRAEREELQNRDREPEQRD